MKQKRNLTGKGLRPFNKYRQAKTLEEYLNTRYTITSEGCWDFTNVADRYGYPHVNDRWFREYGKRTAHTLAYICWKGPIGDLWVLHKCDNRRCINPEHLFLGTAADNNADMMSKNRHKPPHGEAHSRAKLTESDVLYIRDSKDTCYTLADKFNVSFSLIAQVRRKVVWKHVN